MSKENVNVSDGIEHEDQHENDNPEVLEFLVAFYLVSLYK